MNEKYKILDTRPLDSFSKQTFSGFKKSEVINAVLKSIEKKKIENACYWTSECIISGYSLILFEKLINFASKMVHINNPKLPSYLLKKNNILMNQINRIGIQSKDKYLLLRNSQMIRNLFFDIISTLTTSSKTKRYDNYPKLNDEDFDFSNIQKRLCAPMNLLPDNIIKFNEPDELRVIINEIFAMLKNKQFGYDKSCYWIMWLLRWESLHKKKKMAWNIEARDIKDIPKKYQSNIVWILWEIIYEEVKIRKDKNISQQIDSLYELFKCNFTIGKRLSRIPLILNAIGYLTHSINFNLPLRMNYKIYIQVQCNVNKMFSEKKVHEKKNEILIHKKPPKKENIQIEIVQDKLNIFNEVDNIISS